MTAFSGLPQCHQEPSFALHRKLTSIEQDHNARVDQQPWGDFFLNNCRSTSVIRLKTRVRQVVSTL